MCKSFIHSKDMQKIPPSQKAKVIGLVNSISLFKLIPDCDRNFVANRIIHESVPGKNQYLAIRKKCFAQRNNRLPLTNFKLLPDK